MTRQVRLSFILGIASAVALAQVQARSRTSTEVPLSTPPGIMLVDVMQFIGNSAAQFLWRRLGDAHGNPLYTYDEDEPGKSHCFDECAKEFPPFLADARARPYGDWTLVKRPDGSKQWAYQGKPLYRYSGQDPVGEPATSGGNSGETDNPEFYDPGSKIYSPKPGWRRAAYTPEKTLPVPAGLELVSLMTANGYGFITSDTGMPVYTIASEPKDPAQWTPVYAPLLANSVGDFTAVRREDGKRQWAYKGQRLYTYKGDYSRSDINGTLAQEDARIALAYRHYMPKSVAINVYSLRGPLLTTSDGRTIYSETRYHLQYGGRQMREGYRYTYLDAKAVTWRGCMDDCLKTWSPLLASGNETTGGFWEVVERGDGTKQWAFRGALLYTYSGDQKPGDINGNNRHVVVFGDPEGKIDLSATGGDKDPRYDEGAGFYWHVAGLYD